MVSRVEVITVFKTIYMAESLEKLRLQTMQTISNRRLKHMFGDAPPKHFIRAVSCTCRSIQKLSESSAILVVKIFLVLVLVSFFLNHFYFYLVLVFSCLIRFSFYLVLLQSFQFLYYFRFLVIFVSVFSSRPRKPTTHWKTRACTVI